MEKIDIWSVFRNCGFFANLKKSIFGRGLKTAVFLRFKKSMFGRNFETAVFLQIQKDGSEAGLFIIDRKVDIKREALLSHDQQQK